MLNKVLANSKVERGFFRLTGVSLKREPYGKSRRMIPRTASRKKGRSTPGCCGGGVVGGGFGVGVGCVGWGGGHQWC